MSFFKDLKDDVSQAVNELSDETIDATTELTDNDLGMDVSAEEFGTFGESEFDGTEVDNELMNSILEEQEAITKSNMEKRRDEDIDDGVTVITKGTTINGSIISDCSLDVMGTINGDIECIGKLTISGTVIGNSVASEIYVNTKRLEGNLDSEGTVKVGLGTVIVGDIKAGSGVIAGAIKGELDVKGPVVIDSTAIIKGNIKAKSVQMNNGAVVEGFCSLSYASVDIENIFD